MTPLQAALARRLPRRLVAPAMTLVYALLLIGIAVAVGRPVPDLVYIDVPAQ